MRKIKMGILGIHRGLAYGEVYASLTEEISGLAVCETDPEYLEEAKKVLPDWVEYYTDYEEFLNSGIEAVVLCNFFHEHAKFAIPALKKGIAVLSETTPAPTLGECVQLCEAVEEGGAKYMLGANVPHKFGPRELERLYKEGTFGEVIYAEGEYFHGVEPGHGQIVGSSKTKYHWRRWLPVTYYNMHDFGTLMNTTGLMPKKVNAKAIFFPKFKARYPEYQTGDAMSVILTEMENGAIFRTTSHNALGPEGKWFRLVCENGTIETVRAHEESIKYEYNPWDKPEDRKLVDIYDTRPEGIDWDELVKKHGGADIEIAKAFLQYLRDEIQPFFDVYRSVAMSAVGILAWRSVLADGKEMEVPDFRDPASRAKVADDFLTPIPNMEDGSGITLPCSSKPYKALTEE